MQNPTPTLAPLLTACTLALALAACGTATSPDPPADASPDAATVAETAGAGDDAVTAPDVPTGDAPAGSDLPAVTDGDGPGPLPTGEGIFLEGCPIPGQATAREITAAGARLEGPDAVGGAGDLLLMNEQVAVIVSGPDREITYYHYGGILVDAVTLDGCAQRSDDQLEEAGIVLGRIELADPTASIIRAFRGEAAEVIADGSDGGPAVVRVTGVDDYYWLVEYTLINSSLSSGGKPLSQPLGVSFEVDYILDPGASFVRIVVRSRNLTDEPRQVIGASLVTFGDALDVHRFASDHVNLGPLSLDLGIPWVVASDGEGAYAFAIEGGNMGHTNIGGIDLLVDIEQSALLSPNLGPAGGASDTDEMSWVLAIGATDGSSATRHLEEANTAPTAGLEFVGAEVAGVVLEADGAGPAAGTTVQVEIEAATGGWQVIDTLAVGAEGGFEGSVPLFDPPLPLRLRVVGEGRDPAAPVDLVPATDLTLEAEPAGALLHEIVDPTGAPAPARLDLQRDDGWSAVRFVYGTGAAPLPPGSYVFHATRGYEFAPVSGVVEVGAPDAAPLAVTMTRVVDTSGYLSVDTHVHAAPSPDSRVDTELRVLNSAAHGLEVIVATEHEIVHSLQPAVDASGLGHLIATVTGQEVTATSPEHMTMLGVEPDGSQRGGIVEWYQLSFGELVQAIRDRGAGIVIFNHPGYLHRIGWDRVAGAPTVTDPTLFGLTADKDLWAWGFDGVEVQNGHGSPFDGVGSGRFDDWMSFLNHGQRVTGIGCSDAHGTADVGFPRTYYASPTDDPAEMEIADVVGALADGRAVISSGAFLRVTANGAAGPGDTLEAPGGAVDLHVHVEALPEVDVTHVKVLANCHEVANVAATAPYEVVKLDAVIPLELPGDAHVVVLAFGVDPMPEGLLDYDASRTARAMSNPVFVDADGSGAFDAPGGHVCDYGLDPPP